MTTEAFFVQSGYMQRLESTVLEDPRYSVPAPVPGDTGMAWLRGQIVRFSEGTDHQRRRLLTQEVLDALEVSVVPGRDPVISMLQAMGLPPHLLEDIVVIAGAYHPHLPQTSTADDAVECLVRILGSRDEITAAHICLLVQTHAGVSALIATLQNGLNGPPFSVTRRIHPEGREVEVDLSMAHFGRGRHACPGEQLGRSLAAAAHHELPSRTGVTGSKGSGNSLQTLRP
ncbi:hypothetical protein [Arthrobacter sp. CAN_C5]|uniref:hypothetical protein n=1 Tax=Arthrobacter sp. CAN_C5 TaxID=2760706 RepID=UPI001AEAEEF1|nr:hypothetical protein [Arthrobacter sp. CAN_C5]MBP2217041.1 hypothetical protein [Arthrobacter sp. CAN_C5]